MSSVPWSDPRARTVRLNTLAHLRAAWGRASRSSRALVSLYVAAGLAQITAAAVVLALSWHRPCDRPLREYVVARIVLLALVLPLSVTRYVWRAGAHDVQDHHEPVWMARAAFVADVLSTALFLAGNYAIIPSVTCASTNTPLYATAAVFVLLGYLALLLPFLLCLLVLFCLPLVLLGLRGSHWEPWLVRVARGDRARTPGATPEVLARLERFRFHVPSTSSPPTLPQKPPKGLFRAMLAHDEPKATADDATLSPADLRDPSCAICLDAYVDGDVLRRLPCSHTFHLACADTWLAMHAQCPLCKAAVRP